MKLNPDCIRDILLHCEDLVDGRNPVEFEDCDATINGHDYSANEIRYHLSQCEMNGYFAGFAENLIGSHLVSDLTPKAHEFLADIRSETIWAKTKSVSKEVGISSLRGLCQIASNVVTQIIIQHLGV